MRESPEFQSLLAELRRLRREIDAFRREAPERKYRADQLRDEIGRFAYGVRVHSEQDHLHVQFLH